MTWTSFHRRGDVLRDVIASADRRRDGVLPSDVEGVSDTFADDLELLGTLQLKWHTRLAGWIDREQMTQPLDLEDAVVRAWHHAADELPGIRAVLDQHRAHPTGETMAAAMDKATVKERLLLAVAAGQANPEHASSIAVGARIEERARATYAPAVEADARPTFIDAMLDRLRAALAA